MHLDHDRVRYEDIVDFPNPALQESRLWRLGKRLAQVSLTGGVPLPFLDADAPPHFQLHKLREGGKHAVIVVNGFTSKGDLDTSDWQAALGRKFGRATWYHLDWEAFRHPGRQMADLLTIDGLLDAALGTREPSLLGAWHASMLSAQRAGELLAEAILCTPGWRFTLAGHSLGGRVIHFALKELAAHPRKRIENVYLLGAAVGGGSKDDACWERAVGAVKGRIFNCYSSEDGILANLYRGANLMLSQPAGHAGIHFEHERIFHFNCRKLVKGHLEWKPKFGSILAQLQEY